MDIPALIPLSQTGSYPKSEVGPIAKRLHQLLQAGIPVSDTIVIPLHTFEEIARYTHLENQLEEILRARSNHAAALNEIKHTIQQLHLPDHVVNAILSWYHSHPGFMRVMNSENDLFEPSHTNIHGDANLIDSILRIWAEDVSYDQVSQQFILFAEPMIIQHLGQPLISGSAQLSAETHKSQATVYSVWGVYQPDHPDIKPDQVVVDIRTSNVVQRQINPQFLKLVRKPDGFKEKPVLYYRQEQLSLPDDTAHQLAEYVAIAKRKYFSDVTLYWYQQDNQLLISYVSSEQAIHQQQAHSTQLLLTGDDIGQGIVGGRAVVAQDPTQTITSGDILVVKELTPAYKKHFSHISAVVCDRGISSPLLVKQLISLGIPVIVNTQHATSKLHTDQHIVVNANTGQVRSAPQSLTSESLTGHSWSPTITKVYISAGNPEKASQYVGPAVDGIGVLRSEYTFARQGEHPLHIIRSRKRNHLKKALLQTIQAYQQAKPNLPVIYRTQNFTSQELRSLAHADSFEPEEKNPYLGFRGGIKMISQFELFDFELEVIKEALQANRSPLTLLLPFVRTPAELQLVISHIKKHHLRQFPHFSLYLQLNTPENVLQLKHYFILGLDGISFNAKSIHALLHGIDPDDPDIYLHYTQDVQLMRRLMVEVMKVIHSVPYQPHSVQSRPQALLHLEDYQLQLIEAACQMGFDAITVKPDFAPRVKLRIREIEKLRNG